MDAQVIINGNDVSAYLLNLSRQHNYCNISQEFNIELVLDNPFTIDPYNSVVIYEEGNKVLTGFVNSTKKNANEGTITILGQDEYKRAEDYFIETTYTTEINQTVAHWIDFLTGLCNLTVEYTHGNGPFVVKDQEIGLDSVANILTYLIQYAGWYGHIDEDGVLILGKIEKEDDPILIQSTILSIDYEKSYDKTRNVALVFGGMDAQEDLLEPVFAKSRVELPFLPTDQAVVVGNHLIGDQETAESFANELILAFSEPQFIKNLEIIGDPRLRSGIYIEVESSLFTGLALISSISSNFSEDGYKMRLVLDDLCPRFSVAAVQQDILYAGTWGSGVWKRNLNASSWRSISSGLENLYINDLSVDDGLFITSTPSGVYTKLNRGDWFYEDLPIVGSGVSVSGVYTYPAVYASSFDNEFYALVTLSGLATNYTWMYRGFLEDDFVTWSGYPIQISEDSVTRNGAAYVGKDLEGYEFDKYLTVERSKTISANLVAGKPTSSDELDLYFVEDPLTNNIIKALGHQFNEITTVKVSPDSNYLAIIGKRLTDTVYSLYISSAFATNPSKIDDGYGDVLSVGWFPDSQQVLFNTGSKFYIGSVFTAITPTEIPTLTTTAQDIDVNPLDNDTFAWINTDSATRRIRYANTDGTGNTIIRSTTNPIKDFVRWFPNGTRVLYSELIFSSAYQFYGIDTDGTDSLTIDSQDTSTKLTAEFPDTTGEIIWTPEYSSSESAWHIYEKSAIHSETIEIVLDSNGTFNPTIRYDGEKSAHVKINSPNAYLMVSSVHSNTSAAIISDINASLGLAVNPVYASLDNRIIINTDFRKTEIIYDDGTGRQELFTPTELWTFLSPYFDPSLAETDISYIPQKWIQSDTLLILQVDVDGTNDIVVSYHLLDNEFKLISPVTNYIGGIGLDTVSRNFLDAQTEGSYLYVYQIVSVVPPEENLIRCLIDNSGMEAEEVIANNSTGFDLRTSYDQEFLVYLNKDGDYLYKADLDLQNAVLLTTDNVDTLGTMSPYDDYVSYGVAKNIKIVRMDGSDNRVVCIDSSAGTAVLQTVWNPAKLGHIVYDINATTANERIQSVFFRVRIGDAEFYDIDAYGYLKAGVFREPLLLHTVTCSGIYDVVYRGIGFSEVNVDTYIPMSVYGSGGVWYSGDEAFEFDQRIAPRTGVFDMAVKTTTAGSKMMFATTPNGIYRTISSGTPTIINAVDATEIVARTYGSGEIFFSIEDEVKQSNNNGLSYFDISTNLPSGYDITVLRLER